MTRPRCVFHHPFPIGQNDRIGSAVRPVRMVEAFEEIGYQVDLVTGFAKERAERMAAVTASLRAGVKYDFVYSESHTLPTALTEPHHLPLHRLRDFEFFMRFREAGVRVGLFYRDVYWRFDHFRSVYPMWKRLPALQFYRRDWRAYEQTVDHLFLPSRAMAASLPSAWPASRLSALPPGTTCRTTDRTPRPGGRSAFRLVYVGGVTPPLYDLTPLFEYLGVEPRAQLVLCCRQDEWRDQVTRYRVPPNVTVVHRSGTDLDAVYAAADAAVIVRAPHTYLDMAMPVKLGEAMGHGLPIVTSPDTEAARFVEREGIGWTVASATEFGALVDRLLEAEVVLASRQRAVAEVCQRNTWSARASRVREVLHEASE